MKTKSSTIKDIKINNSHSKNQTIINHNWSWKKEGVTIFQNMQKQVLNAYEREICKELIYQNIPEHLRSKVWVLLSGAKKEIKNNPSYYNNLLTISQNVPSFYHKKIESDLQRTIIADNQKEKDEMMNHQRNILLSYSIRNSSIGYCQGFNFIVNKLYQIIQDEEETFWVFCQIIEDILPLNFYSELIGLMIDATIIYGLIKVFFPKLNEYFEKIKAKIDPIMFIHKWLVSLFIQSFTDDTVNYILDMFFLEGNKVIIQVTLSIFFLLEKYIISQGSNVDCLLSIINKGCYMITPILLFPFFKNNIFKFSNKHLNTLRQEMFPDIIRSFSIDPQVKCILLRSDKMEKCSHSYPYCLTVGSIEIKSQGIEYLILSQQEQFNIIEDYYFDILDDRNAFIEEEEEENFYNILLERRKHYCNKDDDSLSDCRKFSDSDSERSTNSNSIEKIKTLKINDKEAFISERLSRLSLVAENQFNRITRLSIMSRVNDCNKE